MGNLSSKSKSQGPSRIDTDAFEDNICGTIFHNRNIHKFNTNENYIEDDDLSNKNVKGDIVANKLPSCSRKRRSCKPTRRYIKEFPSIKKEPTIFLYETFNVIFLFKT